MFDGFTVGGVGMGTGGVEIEGVEEVGGVERRKVGAVDVGEEGCCSTSMRPSNTPELVKYWLQF